MMMQDAVDTNNESPSLFGRNIALFMSYLAIMILLGSVYS